MHDYGKKETEAANYATKQQQHKLIPLLFFLYNTRLESHPDREFLLKL